MRVYARAVRPALLAALALAIASHAQPQPTRAATPAAGRVVLVSLDGLGGRALDDPALAEALPTLRAVADRGARASGLQPHTPSTTANTHAALWTGAWGAVNGITGNTMPVPPRADHTVLERAVGFRADHLRAEPLWVTAARQGVPAVVQQASQGYPFVPATVGAGSAHPVVLNGYQTRVLSPARVLRADDVTRVACESGSAPPAVACVTWTTGPLRFTGRLAAPVPGSRAMRLEIASPQARHVVEAVAHPTETGPPHGRPLARYFSDGLLIDGAGDVGPVMVYFRLFEADADGTAFVLYHTAIHTLALYDGGRDTTADVRALLTEAGGFLGNAGGYQWERPEAPLGRTLAEGGDGLAERRFLETLEVAVRQVQAHTRWLWQRYSPRLLVAYTSLPDELDHRLLALAKADPRYQSFRQWGYALVDTTVATFTSLTTPNDHLVFVSDHGLAPVTHEVRVAVALQRAGLLTLDAAGRVDVGRTQVVPMRNCLIVNGTDWKHGIVAPERRAEVLARAIDALKTLAVDGQPVVDEVVRGPEDERVLGFGGPNGADACFGLRGGFAVDEHALTGDPIVRRRLPKGDHNFLGTRAEMQGLLVAAGPRITAGTRWPAARAIDVAPSVTDLLGIAPPAQATGHSLLRD